MTTTAKTRSAGRPFVLLGVIVLALLVALVAVAVIAAPKIVSKIASAAVAEAAGEALGGTGTARVTIGWNTPATIESLTVTDPSGRTLADLRVTTELGLLDAIRFDGDAGTVGVSGSLVLGRGAMRGSTGGGSGNGGSSGGSAADLSSVRDLIATLELSGLDLTIEDDAGEIVTLDGLDASLALDRGAFDISASSTSPELTIAASGDGFLTSDGALDVRAGKAAGSLDAVFERETLERALGAIGLASSGTTGVTVVQPSLRGDRTVLRLAGTVEDGLLEVHTSSGPSNIPMIDAVLARFGTTGGAPIELATRPSLSVTLQTFAIGLLPEGGGLVDTSRGSLIASATLSGMSVTTTDGSGERTRNETTPLEINVNAKDLSGKMDATFGTNVAVNGQRTGGVSITGSIENPLTDRFGFNRGALQTLRVYADVQRIPTPLIEPLFADLPWTAAEIVGPVLAELDLSVESAEGDGAFGDVRVTFRAKSDGFEVNSPELVLKDGALVSDEDFALKIDTLRATTLMRSYAGEGVELLGDGVGAVAILNPRIPLRDGFWPDLANTSGEVRVIVGDFAARRAGTAEAPISFTSLDSRLTLTPGVPADLVLDYRFAHEGRVFDLYSKSTIDGLNLPSDVREGFAFDASALTARVLAKFSNVPTDLLRLVSDDLAEVAEALGGETVTLTLRPRAEDADGATTQLVHTLGVETDTSRFGGGAVIDVRDGVLSVNDALFTGEMTPLAFEILGNTYAPGVGGEAMSLLATEAYTLTLSEARMTLRDGLIPEADSLRNVTASVSFADDVIVKNVERPDKEGTFVDAGLRELVVRYRHDGKDASRREAVVLGRVFDPKAPASEVGTLRAVSAAGGAMDVEVTLDEVRPEALDAWLGLEGTAALALGGDARAEAQIKDQLNPDGRAYFLSLGSERLTTRVNLLDQGGAMGLVEPIAATWDVPEALLERFVRIDDAETGENRLRVTELAPIVARVDRLTLGPAGDRFAPGVFNVEALFGTRSLAFSVEGEETFRFEDITARVTPESGNAGTLAFEVSAQEPGEAGTVSASGTVSGLREGVVRLNMNARGDVPTMLLDAAARSNGAVYDLLGPVTTIDLRAADLSRETGHALLNVISEHARASIEGDARDGVFYAADGARVTVSRISKDISRRYLETVLPFLTRFEKTTDDDPAVAVAEGLTIPMNGDMSTLNGIVTVDLGTVQFDTSQFFGNILERTNNNRSGSLGGKVEPFLLTINQGIMSYERTKIPTGEYVIETRGTVDLVKKRMDIVLYLPFSSLSGDLRKAFKQVPGLDTVGLAPIRIKGKFGDPKVEPALDLLVKEGVPQAAERVIDDLIKKGLEDLFKKK